MFFPCDCKCKLEWFMFVWEFFYLPWSYDAYDPLTQPNFNLNKTFERFLLSAGRLYVKLKNKPKLIRVGIEVLMLMWIDQLNEFHVLCFLKFLLCMDSSKLKNEFHLKMNLTLPNIFMVIFSLHEHFLSLFTSFIVIGFINWIWTIWAR